MGFCKTFNYYVAEREGNNFLYSFHLYVGYFRKILDSYQSVQWN